MSYKGGLVVTLKRDECVRLGLPDGEEVLVEVVEVADTGRVQLRIEAPKSIPIARNQSPWADAG